MFDLIVSVYSRFRRWIIAAGLVLFTYGIARADWQVHEWDGQQWAAAVTPKGRTVAVNSEKTACDLDLASLAMVKPPAARLRCSKVK